MRSYQWSAELQDGGKSCCSRHRRLIICAVISGFTSALLAIAFVTVWCMYDDSDKYLSAGEVTFTVADWERVFVESGPLKRGWEKETE